jgi:hypothetical protein
LFRTEKKGRNIVIKKEKLSLFTAFKKIDSANCLERNSERINVKSFTRFRGNNWNRWVAIFIEFTSLFEKEEILCNLQGQYKFLLFEFKGKYRGGWRRWRGRGRRWRVGGIIWIKLRGVRRGRYWRIRRRWRRRGRWRRIGMWDLIE